MRAAPQVPLVVFPLDGSLRRAARLGHPQTAALADALATVAALGGTLAGTTGRCRELDAALEHAVVATRRLATVTDRASPRAEEVGAVARSPVHDYFGVRAAPLTPEQHAAQTAAVVFRALADLRYALVDGAVMAAEVAAVAAVLGRLLGGGQPDGQVADPVADRAAGRAVAPVGLYEPRGDGLERWITVHHLYFLLNLYAAATVGEATAALAGGGPDPDGAAALLAEARIYVRGFTAGMVHSAAVPPGYYRDVVRPTMQPPAATKPLTGGLQPEHAAYRSAVRRLLEASPEPFWTLHGRHPCLASARDAFLEADLLDIERHAGVAEGLVGNAHSLVQREQAPDNAVSTLRQMRHARAARYSTLMRFGDQLGVWAMPTTEAITEAATEQEAAAR
jgi:hypothetical protein